MGFLGIDEDRIIQQIMPELQRITTSFETLMIALIWAVIICLVIYIWRQRAEEKRAKEIHAANMKPRLCENCQSAECN